MNVLYGWSRICGQFGLRSFMFSFAQHQSQSFFYYFIILLHSIFFFPLTRSLLVPYVYVSIESIDFIILSSLALNVILLNSPVNALYILLLILCCDFDINFCFLWIVFYVFYNFPTLFQANRVNHCEIHRIFQILNINLNKILCVATLKEVIFAGSNFCKFRKFWLISRKLIPAKYLAKMNSWKLIFTENTK